MKVDKKNVERLKYLIKNFVIEWKTISAPKSSGFCKYGLQKVLSTATKIPCYFAILQTASISVIPIVGFAGVSININFVFGRIAFLISSISSEFT